jgi:Na+-transporting methylmalonyl-CoA/oxaloacetate decarboxylase gamma subunit
LLLGVVFGWVRSIPVLSGTAVVLVFLFFFALLMALVARRETPRPPSPH